MVDVGSDELFLCTKSLFCFVNYVSNIKRVDLDSPFTYLVTLLDYFI